MGAYTLVRPGGTDITPATEGGANTPAAGKLVGAPFADGAGPYPIGKSSDYVLREAAKKYASGGKTLTSMDTDEDYSASQVFAANVAGAVSAKP